ncbi:GD11580 [Drosophila simulans]|uniref:GD11580 n=1 Tax=Drosophila simulans TaxID=7240 RepID=B4QG05_DROSI|nr:GD11580 [Drosophila simulans]
MKDLEQGHVLLLQPTRQCLSRKLLRRAKQALALIAFGVAKAGSRRSPSSEDQGQDKPINYAIDGGQVRQKTKAQQQQQQQQHTLQETRSYCTSEPRLSETETPPQRRKLSQRRPQTHAHRKSNAFLDVPTMNMHHLRVNDDDEDVDRLRTFSASKGGELGSRELGSWDLGSRTSSWGHTIHQTA